MTLEGGGSSFERRAEEALRRRKIPVEDDSVIELPDRTAELIEADSPEAVSETKRFFTLLPGEIPQAPAGGDYILDASADPAASGVFEYAGQKLRPVTPEEYAEITAITANPASRREKGPRRLSTLNTAPANPPADVDASAARTSRNLIRERRQLERDLGPEAGRVMKARQKYWINADGSAKIIYNGIAQDIPVGGIHDFSLTHETGGRRPGGPIRLKWKGVSEGWVSADTPDRNPADVGGGADRPAREEDFELHTTAGRARGGAAGDEPNYYRRRMPDGAWEKNPDGTERRYSAEEKDRLLGAGSADHAANDAPYSSERLSEAQKNLMDRLFRSGASAEFRRDFGNRVLQTNDAPGIRELSRQLRDFEREPASAELERRIRDRFLGRPARPAAGAAGGGGEATPPGDADGGGIGAGGPPLGTPFRRPPFSGYVPEKFIPRRFARFYPAQDSIIHTEPTSMDVILNDPKKQAEFGALLKRFGRDELIPQFMESRTNGNAMDNDDWQELRALRNEYDQRVAFIAEVKDGLNDADFDFMLQHEANLGFLTNSLKPGRARELLRQHLDTVFMTGTNEEVRALIYGQRAMRDIRSSKQYAGIGERAKTKLGLNVDPDKLDWDALDKRTLKLLRRPKLWDWGQNSARSKQTIDYLNANRMEIMKALGATFSRDPELRARIVNEAVTKKKAVSTPEIGAPSMSEAVRTYESEATLFDEDRMLARIRDPEFRRGFRTHGTNKTWDEATPAEREETFFTPHRREVERHRSALGWFGQWLLSLFETRFNRTRAVLQAQNAFA